MKSDRRPRHLQRQPAALTSPPAVEIAVAHPWHPDLQQRGLREPLLLQGRADGESHVEASAGSR